MLKGINPLLNADVLHVLRAMGHGMISSLQIQIFHQIV